MLKQVEAMARQWQWELLWTRSIVKSNVGIAREWWKSLKDLERTNCHCYVAKGDVGAITETNEDNSSEKTYFGWVKGQTTTTVTLLGTRYVAKGNVGAFNETNKDNSPEKPYFSWVKGQTTTITLLGTQYAAKGNVGAITETNEANSQRKSYFSKLKDNPPPLQC